MPEEKLEARQKELLSTVEQAVISSYLKSELDATLKNYGKRVYAFMKAKKDAEMQKVCIRNQRCILMDYWNVLQIGAPSILTCWWINGCLCIWISHPLPQGIEEALVLAEAAKESKAPFIVAVLETPGNIATKIVASVAKVVPDASVCVLMRDTDKGKLQVATLVTKAQQAKTGAGAGDWLKAINEVADGKGGGKADRAVGQASLDKIQMAEEAANKYAAASLV
jgi:hypothetical protein